MGTRSRAFVGFTVTGLGLGLLGSVASLVPGCSAAGAFGSEIFSPSLDGGPLDDGSVPAADSGVISGDGGILISADATAPDGSYPTDASYIDVPNFTQDGGSIDSAVGGPPFAAHFLAVHASANLFDFRVCFGTPGAGIVAVPPYPDDPAQPMPETNYPGVPLGGAALLPTVMLPSDVPITPYVIRAQTLANEGTLSTNPTEPTCDQLICGSASCLTRGADYIVLPPFFPGSTSAPLLLAVGGCVDQGTSAGSIAQCGSSYVPSGNLTTLFQPLESVDGGGPWAFQLAQLSPSFAASLVALDAGEDDGGDEAGIDASISIPASLTFVDPVADASSTFAVPAFGAVSTPMTAPLSEAGATLAYFTLSSGATQVTTQSLAAIQYFQSPASDPFTYFSSGSLYFVAVVGDATDASAPASLPDGAANPAFDGHGLHVIAYPN